MYLFNESNTGQVKMRLRRSLVLGTHVLFKNNDSFSFSINLFLHSHE